MKGVSSISKILIFAVLLFSVATVFAKTDPALFSTMKARSIGPAGMSGRIADIDVVLSNTNIIYTATATGGLWKSENGGVSWLPIFDDQPASSIGAVTIFQKNPNILWVGTGEPLPRNSCGVGRGVFKSLDAGKTWLPLGLTKTEKISAIRLDPNNPDIAYVSAMGTTWGENKERGVFKTLDGGKTWKKILYVDEKTGAAELVMDPSNPNKLIAAMWEHRRWPWFFNSGGPGSGLYITMNGGDTWKKLSDKDGLPKGNLGRCGIAFAESRPNIVYALVEAEKSELLRSQDGGLTWKTVNKETGISNRPFYYSRFKVNPRNENIIYLLQSDFLFSEDGGKSFNELTSRGQAHADFHALWLHPNGEDMINGNDGGIVISNDRGKTWRFVRNLPLGQFYHVSFDMEVPYNVYGGLQDNGSWRGPSSSLLERSLSNYMWKTVGGGDGFDVEPDPQDSDCGYGMSQGGNLFYYDIKTGSTQDIVPTESDVTHRYNWNAGFAIDPFAPATIYLGSQFVHRSKNKGQSWEIISPDLTTNDPEKQKQDQSGGLTRDVTNAENHTTIMCIAPSPVKKGVIWVGTDDGNLQVTTDNGKNWELVSTNINKGIKKNLRVPAHAYISHVEASKFDTASAFVVFDDHRRSNWTSYAYVTHDFGKTWQSLVTPGIDGFIHVIEQDNINKDLLFIGTEFGLFISLNGGKEWFKWTYGLPTVPVRDLAVHPRDNDLIIGTHGRSIYIIDDISPLRETASALAANKKLHLFKVNNTFSFQRGRLSSFHSPADGSYSAKNKETGAYITYYLVPSEKKKQTPNKDTARRREMMKARMAAMGNGPRSMRSATADSNVNITITDSQGKKVRTIKGSETKGINRVNWNLRGEMPEGMMSARARRFGRGGMPVLPGTYTVTIEYNGIKESQPLEVKSDPRLDIDIDVLKANQKLSKEVMKLSGILNDAEKQIKETQKLIKTITQYAAGTPTPKNKIITKGARDLAKKLKEMAAKIKPDEDRQGIFDRSVGLSRQVRSLMRPLRSSHKPATQAVKVKFQKMKKEVDSFIETFNSFYKVDVEQFKKTVQDSGFSLFKPYQPLKIK